MMYSLRSFDEMHIWIEFSEANEIDRHREVCQKFGHTIKKLDWSNWSKFQMSEKDFVEILNSMPNLEILHLSSWRSDFLKMNSPQLKLMKLKQVDIIDCQPFIMELLIEKLPPNILMELHVNGFKYADEIWIKFTSKQTSIQVLDIDGEHFNARPFIDLKLKRLKCVLQHNDTPSNQRLFLIDLIRSQQQLTHFDALIDRDFAFSFINDEIFRELCKLKYLECLKINIDAISPDVIQNISCLKNLNALELKTNIISTLQVFNELSLIRNSSMESMIFHMWSFEIPAQIYRNFGENFTNLKSLTITLGTWHKLNFYMETFPNLKSLNIRFGEANNTMEFEQAYDDDGQIHTKMTSLKLQFWGNAPINVQMFIKMRNSFPNLESLDIDSNFPFTQECLNALVNNIHKLRSLRIGSIKVKSNEEFDNEKIELLRSFSQKLRHCKLNLINVLDHFFRFHRGHERRRFGETEHDVDFSFQPLEDALRCDFKISSYSMSNIRTYNHMILEAGKQH